MWSALTLWVGFFGGLGAAFSFFGAKEKEKSNFLLLTNEMSTLGIGLFVACSDMDRRLFGERIISLRSFLISTAITIISVIFVSAIIGGFAEWDGASHMRFTDFEYGRAFDEAAILISDLFLYHPILLTAFLANILFDFFSVCETRLVIKVMRKTRSLGISIILLVIDFVVSVIIAVITIVFLAFIIWLVNIIVFDGTRSIGEDLVELWRLPLEVLNSPDGYYPSVIFIYLAIGITSIVTSVWIWLHWIGWIVGSITSRFDRLNSLAGFFALAARGSFAVALCGLFIVPLLHI